MVLTITRIEGNRVGVGIEAPQEISVRRSKPCKGCGYPTFETYLGYHDIPFCGKAGCAERLHANQQTEGMRT